jgi:hypothetical protein
MKPPRPRSDASPLKVWLQLAALLAGLALFGYVVFLLAPRLR